MNSSSEYYQLYTDQVVDMVKTAYWIRNKEHEKPEDELIEITEEFFWKN